MKRSIVFLLSLLALGLTACQSTQTTPSRIQISNGTQDVNLHPGQNAIIHYQVGDGERKYKYCNIVAADGHWLTVADKAEKSAESTQLSGWHSMIPIEKIIMIRVEVGSQ